MEGSRKNEAIPMIRMAQREDVPAMLEIYRPYILETAYTFEYTVPSLAEFTQRFDTIHARFPWLVWEEDGEILGYAYADAAFVRAAYQWDADLSIYLKPEAKGQGGGRRLYEILEDLLRAQGYFLVYGIITSCNKGSCAFHEAMGYRESAFFPACGFKFGQWYGTYWYEKRLQDGDPTSPPRGWRELEKLPESWNI